MIRYYNASHVEKCFYGVTFKPGETHEVPGYINDPKFVRMPEVKPAAEAEPVPEATSKVPSKAPSKETSKETPKDTSKPKASTSTASTKTKKTGGKTDGTDSNK